NWIDCTLIRIGIINSVNNSIDQLTQLSTDFDLGWSTAPPPPQLINLNDSTYNVNLDYFNTNHSNAAPHPNYRHLNYSNGLQRSAGLCAVLKFKYSIPNPNNINPIHLISSNCLSRGHSIYVIS